MSKQPSLAARTSPSASWSLAAVVAAVVSFLCCVDGGSASAAEKRMVRLFSVPAPLADRTETELKRAVRESVAEASREGAHLTLVFELEPGKLEFGRALDFARFLSGPELQGAKTVAFIPSAIEGHLALPALACEEIVMHDAAVIGDAGKFEPQITDDLRASYLEIARRRRAVPEPVVEAIIDKRQRLFRVELAQHAEFVLEPGLQKLQGILKQEEVKPAGEPAHFTGQKAREWGFVSELVQDEGELAKKYDTTVEALREKTLSAEPGRAVRIDLRTSVLQPEQIRRAQRLMQTALGQEKNLIIFWIDSDGGAVSESLALAGAIADIDSRKCRTIAYVNERARGDALLIAWACQSIIVNPNAVLGGEGSSGLSRDDLMVLVTQAPKIAEKRFRTPTLLKGFFDADLRIHRYQQGKNVEFLTEEDRLAKPNPDAWDRKQEVKSAEKLLEITGKQGFEEFQVVSDLVQNLAELQAVLKLDGDPVLMEPTWADGLVDALRSRQAATFFLTVAILAFWLEFLHPTFGLGWLIFIICIGLYFWSNVLGGTAGWLEIVLFVMGMAFLLFEIFVIPGVTVFGLAGGVLIVASLVLASQSFILPNSRGEVWQLAGSLGTVASAMFLAMAGIAALWQVLPASPILERFRGREEIAESTMNEPASHVVVGAIGKAYTRLAPSGKVLVGDQLLDVITTGDFVERGDTVRVVEAIGNRIVVRPDDPVV